VQKIFKLLKILMENFFDLRDDHEQKMNLLLLFTLFTLLYMLTKIFLSKSI